MSNALTTTNAGALKKAPMQTIKDLLNGEDFRTKLKECLPLHLTPERQARVLINCVTKKPELANCDLPSLFACMLDCSAMGLEPDGRLAHLIPYGKTCTLIVDYKGLIQLVMNSDKVDFIDAFLVYEKELDHDAKLGRPRFMVQYGGDPKIIHDPILVGERGKVVGTYAIAHIKGVSKPKFCWMTTEEIEAVRKRSKAAHNGPWVSDWGEMAKKTPIRRISKTLPLSYEIQELLEKEVQHEFGSVDLNRFEAAKPAKPATITVSTGSAAPTAAVFDLPPADAAEESAAGLAPELPKEPPQNAPASAATAPPQPPPAKPTNIPATTPEDPAKLAEACIKAGITEEQLCKWAVAKFKFSPCSTVGEMWEIAPRKVSQILANFDTFKNEIKATK